MNNYLDTNSALWLATGKFYRFSPRAISIINRQQLLLSPTALLELEYLFEIKRTVVTATDILSRLAKDYELKLCSLPFDKIATTALYEKWTRDPFDRLIVAQARTNGLATLITADAHIQQNYPNTLI